MAIKNLLNVVAIIAFLIWGTTVQAETQENDTLSIPPEYEDIAETTPPKQIDWETRIPFGSEGNVTVYVNQHGTPTEIYVVGIAPVSTTMIAVEAEDFARREAMMNAKAAFAIWMHENLEVKNVFQKKTLVVRTNAESKGGKNATPMESSESSTMEKTEAIQTATAAWRGMRVFWHKLKGGRYIAVWRWKATEHRLARIVEIMTNDGAPEAANRKADMKVREFDGMFR